MKCFHLIFNGKRVDGEVRPTGSYGRYKITAENEDGDTFSIETTDAIVYDYISSDMDEDAENREYAEAWMLHRFEDEDNWLYKATYKAYPTNVTIFYGGHSFKLDCDLQGEVFDCTEELREWLDDSLWEIRESLNNYDDLIVSLCCSLDRYIKGVYDGEDDKEEVKGRTLSDVREEFGGEIQNIFDSSTDKDRRFYELWLRTEPTVSQWNTLRSWGFMVSKNISWEGGRPVTIWEVQHRDKDKIEFVIA